MSDYEYRIVEVALPETPESQHHADQAQREDDERRAQTLRDLGPEGLALYDEYQRDVQRRMLGLEP